MQRLSKRLSKLFPSQVNDGTTIRGNEAALAPTWRTATIALMAILIYTAAAFMANEWLYLMACGFAAIIFIGLVVPPLTLATLRVSCWLPPAAVADENSQLSIALTRNPLLAGIAWAFPAECLTVRILLVRRSVQGYTVENELSNQPVFIEEMDKQALLNISLPLLQRGVYKLANTEVSTQFPFNMARSARYLKTAAKTGQSLIVYPRSYPLSGNFLTELQGLPSHVGISCNETLALFQSTSVRTIREFQTGDSQRHIHWPSSARLGKLLVRQFDSETLPVYDLYFDLCANWTSRKQFELAVCLVTALVNFGYDHDIAPHLHLNPNIESEELSPLMCDLPAASAPLDELVEILARVEPCVYRHMDLPADISPNREILAILPAFNNPQLISAKSQMGSSPVQLALVQRNSGAKTNRSDWKVIATIYSETDMQAL